MNINNSLLESFDSYQCKVRAELKEIIDSNSSSLYNMLRYHMGWRDENGNPCYEKSSKFIRPTLCLLSCQAVGGDIPRILPAAAALELVHNLSLIHDDIQDDSSERHHRPTVWKLWGQPQAINAGDAMYALAYSTLLRLRENSIPDKKVIGSVQILSAACMELCEGQFLDIEYESRLDVTIEDYLSMATKKTAALIAASTSLGAYLGSEDEGVVNSFYLFGKGLGMAYQIRDDILGIWGVEENVGKSTNDISQKKKTLPVVYGLQNSKPAERKKLEELYSRESLNGDDVAQVIEILEQTGARDYAQNLAEHYHYQTLAQCDSIGIDTSNLDSLKKLVHFLLERDY